MIRRPPRSTLSSSSAASDVYKRQVCVLWLPISALARYGVATLASLWGLWICVLFLLSGWWERGVSLYHLKLCVYNTILLPQTVVLKLPPFNQLTNLSLIHISEPTRLLSISYAVFCLKKKK
eukprot:TRINITY_DN12114_c0_g1_i1.p1 TRINITY_DN12114_c0_g1~~TRINITY_DN12114_c0_g1_i1.p1  ORF type:complete len:122 (+),score=15.14 TRINITY_DN12114_c0_g1_i1:123-488(+)